MGVVEATIPTLHFMHEVLDLDEKAFMQATQTTFKLDISFENWRNVGEDYFHSFGKTGKSHWTASFQHFWLEGRQRGLASDYGDYRLELRAAMDNRFATLPDNGINYAYHLDATLYGAFLRRFSEALGVQRIEGKIVQVHTDDTSGHITALTLDRGERLEGDFFIDCTASRVRYTRAMRDAMEARGLGWQYWELAAGFGVHDPEAGRLRPDLAAALFGP